MLDRVLFAERAHRALAGRPSTSGWLSLDRHHYTAPHRFCGQV